MALEQKTYMVIITDFHENSKGIAKFIYTFVRKKRSFFNASEDKQIL